MKIVLLILAWSSLAWSYGFFGSGGGSFIIPNPLNVQIGNDLVGLPGVQFAGSFDGGPGYGVHVIAAKTGFGASNYIGDTALVAYVAGYEMMRWEGITTGERDITVLATLRCDTLDTCNMGRKGNGFNHLYLQDVQFGSAEGGVGYDMTRRLWFSHQNWSNGAGIGLGFDALNGNEAFFGLWDPTVNSAYGEVSFKLDNRLVTVGPSNDSTINANPANSVRAKGADKTAGTGDGGDALLQPGSSVGGNPGNSYIPAGTLTASPHSYSGMAPIKIDTTGLNTQLCVYVDSTWKCVQMQ